jgi:hypothetical protein
MSEGRFDGYSRNIGKFVERLGSDAAIDAIHEAKFEGFFTRLSVQVAAEQYSPKGVGEEGGGRAAGLVPLPVPPAHGQGS